MKFKIKKYSKNSIQLASRSLLNGSTIILPTDTVYGIAALATNKKAVEKIFKVKKRPKSLPLIIFVKSIKDAAKIAKFSPLDMILARKLWPGPLTLILRKKKSKIYNGDKRLSKIGIRIPKNKTVLALLNKIKKPLATTSANLHKEKNTRKIDNLNILVNENIDIVISSSEKMSFKESTLLETSKKEVKIIRSGQINKKIIRKVIKSHGYSHKIKRYIKNRTSNNVSWYGRSGLQ